MIPKYMKVFHQLKDKIKSGEYLPGQLIPSERLLIDEFGVSRITIRRAISELVNQNYLITEQGKGTFVKTSFPQFDLLALTSCTEDILKLGYTPKKKALEHQVLKATKEEQEAFGIEESVEVFHLTRVYYAGDTAVNYTATKLRMDLFPGIDKYNFERDSLYQVLQDEYGLEIVSARRTIEVGTPEKSIQKALEMENPTPILLIHCITKGTVNGELYPFESYVNWHRSDRFKFYLDQQRVPRKKGNGIGN